MGKAIYGFIEKIYMFFVELLFKIIKKDLTDKKSCLLYTADAADEL